MEKLIPEEYKYCRQRLEAFRMKYNWLSQRRTLNDYPFDMYLTWKLFSQKRLSERKSLCDTLGRHLVLKIIDELLDDGTENSCNTKRKFTCVDL